MRSNPNDTLAARNDTFVPPGSQVTVTVGRNVGATPMPEDEWQGLQASVRTAVADYFEPAMTFGPFVGTGEWEGIVEESAVEIFVTKYPGSVKGFESRLSTLAEIYGQDAIAWSFGPNLLALPQDASPFA